MITLIWAQSKNNVIGKENKLPWHIKEEMLFFVEYTKNKTVLMGRNTWESLTKKPLPNRQNIVITSRTIKGSFENLIVSNNLENEIIKYIDSKEELVVIGGKLIYDQTINVANKLVISIINSEYQGDTFAPNIDSDLFYLTNKSEHIEFSVCTYERK